MLDWQKRVNYDSQTFVGFTNTLVAFFQLPSKKANDIEFVCNIFRGHFEIQDGDRNH